MPISLSQSSFHSASKPKSVVPGNVERPVTITGRLTKPVTSVTINQQQATLEQGGLAFSFPRFFLREGTNMITAVALDAKGRVVSSAVTVSVDQTAPILRIEAPEDKSITSNSRIDVRGMVNDAVEALHGAPEPRVSVSVNGQTITTAGQNAQVSDRYFLIPEVPLQIGDNQLRITATDHLGNARSQDIRISRISAGSERFTSISDKQCHCGGYGESLQQGRGCEFAFAGFDTCDPWH